MEFIGTDTELSALVDALRREECVALDTESDNFHRYPERLCLVQIAGRGSVFIVDPLAIGEMAPLGRLLDDPRVQKIFHSGDNDLRALDRQWGFHVRNLYDTSVAASFLGLRRLGLDNLLREVLGVEIVKDKNIQRADWSRRPLRPRTLAYAVDDVAYLLLLRAVLEERLEALGRRAWVAEECARLEGTRYIPPRPIEESFLLMKGSRDLDGRGLAVLRELVVMREAEARRRGVPPFRVLANSVLLTLARDPESDLADLPGLGHADRRRMGGKIQEAVRAGLGSPPVRRPMSPMALEPRWTKAQVDRLRVLKEWRALEGNRWGLDPFLIWPMGSLERLARDPTELEAERTAAEVRRWQWDQFSEPLLKRLTALRHASGRS